MRLPLTIFLLVFDFFFFLATFAVDGLFLVYAEYVDEGYDDFIYLKVDIVLNPVGPPYIYALTLAAYAY
jgi:hypothetical protein